MGDSIRCQACREVGINLVPVGQFHFHREHFNCSVCSDSLLKQPFLSRDGIFYCKPDFLAKFVKTCSACSLPIDSGRLVNSGNDKHYHGDCFKCSVCSEVLTNQFASVDGSLFCSKHVGYDPSQVCYVCGQVTLPIDKVTVDDKLYHKKCLKCSACSIALADLGNELYRKDGDLFCEMDYNILCAMSCTSCGLVKLSVPMQTVNEEAFHPECFICSECKVPLENYLSVEGDLRCQTHSGNRNTIQSCLVCTKSIPGDDVHPAAGFKFHENCLNCHVCGEHLSKDQVKVTPKNDVICSRCLYTKMAKRRKLEADRKASDYTRSSLIHASEGTIIAPSGTHNISEEVLSNWKKGQLIGVGQFGKVYVGLLESGQWIAVKEMEFKEKSLDDIHMAMVQSEVDLLSQLDHRNVVKLLGTQRTLQSLNILMEYISGKSLDVLLENFGAFDEPVLKNYSRMLCLALQHCHERGIIHRDLKGKNVLVDVDGQIKLCDFGSAKQLQSLTSKEAPTASYNYTPLWTAPEVMTCSTYDRKVDIWSLGCVIIEMTTAKMPWSECEFPSPFSALFHIGSCGSIPKFPETLSGNCKDFLRACLTRDPDKRPDAAELLKHPFLTS